MLGSILLLLASDALWALYAFACAAGVAYMGVLTALTALIGRSFGLANVGKVLGLLNISFGLAAFLGPLLGGILFDAMGSYRVAFIGVAGAAGIAALLVTQVKSDGRRA